MALARPPLDSSLISSFTFDKLHTSNFPTKNNPTTIIYAHNQNLKITPSNTTPSAINRELKFSLELAKTGQILKP